MWGGNFSENQGHLIEPSDAAGHGMLKRPRTGRIMLPSKLQILRYRRTVITSTVQFNR